MPTIDIQVAATADDCRSYAAGVGFTNNSALQLLDIGDDDVFNWVRFVMGATPIPSGATVTNCYLRCKSTANDAAISSLLIKGLDVDNVGNFPDWATSNGYALTAAELAWVTGAWLLNVSYNSGDISAVVQEIVDLMDGIATGEHIGFRINNTAQTGIKRCHSWDAAGNDQGVILHVEFPTYQPRPAGMAVGTTLIF